MPDAREAVHASGSPGFAFAIFQFQYIAFPFPSASALGHLRSLPPLLLYVHAHPAHRGPRAPIGVPPSCP